MKAVHLRCEYLSNPLGIGSMQPRLSWEPPCDQAAYQIQATQGERSVWDTGRVDSDQTTGVRYQGKPLQARAQYEWQVRVWAKDGTEHEWSEPALWGMGPAEGFGWDYALPRDWEGDKDRAAYWIGVPFLEGREPIEDHSLPMFRKEFSLQETPESAIIYISALGVYELRINGQKVSAQVLAPEWTDYHQKVQYQAYDVASLLSTGENVLAVYLGPGWYAGRLGMAASFANTQACVYGKNLAFIAQLHLRMSNDREMFINTDTDWDCYTDGPIITSDLLDGEVYDARREVQDWETPGMNTEAWKSAVHRRGVRLVPQPNEPITITREVEAVSTREMDPGTWIADFGQNLVGVCRLRVSNTTPGQEIILKHAEMLNPDGTIYLENMRGARPFDRYVCNGADEETYQPRFTYHGFRYVEINGLTAELKPEDICACVFHSDAPEAGHIETSDPLLDRLVDAIKWTQRGNMHSTMTDCPQRDERLGWTGDAQVFCQNAIFNMDMAAFLNKYIADICEAQTKDGRFPDFAPHPYNPDVCFSGNPGWGEAGIIMPWRHYVNYGDTTILENVFESAKRHIDWSLRRNPDLIWSNRSQLTPLWYGDWLNADTFIDIQNLPDTGGEVPKEIFSTAYFAYAAQLLANMAVILKRGQDADYYQELAEKIRARFNEEFVSGDGHIRGETQAGYVFALNFDLLPEAIRQTAAGHLVKALEPYNGAPSTGIHSTVRLLLELSRYGYHEEACNILMRTEMPSWFYMLNNGGTTIWERWDGWVEGRGFQNPGMNSFNHYAIGAVGEWIYRVLGGLNPDVENPGWKHFFINPIPGCGLTWMKTSYHSIRGPICSEWNIEDNRLRLQVAIPPNTTATVILPGSETIEAVKSGKHCFESDLV